MSFEAMALALLDGMMTKRAKWFIIAGASGLCLSVLGASNVRAQGHPTGVNPPPAVSKKSFASASIHALPGLQCSLYPSAGDQSKGLTVFTDDDGYARFHAVRAAAHDAAR